MFIHTLQGLKLVLSSTAYLDTSGNKNTTTSDKLILQQKNIKYQKSVC